VLVLLSRYSYRNDLHRVSGCRTPGGKITGRQRHCEPHFKATMIANIVAARSVGREMGLAIAACENSDSMSEYMQYGGKRMIGTVSRLVLFASIAAAGPQTGAPAFDVASIQASQSGKEIIEPLPGSLTMRNIRLTAIIAWSYHVEEYQVSGPTWLNDARFDVLAKSATAAPEAELRGMLQKLLADRFQMTLHRQVKEMPALVLTVAKGGHKLEAVAGDSPSSFKTGKMNLTGQRATLSDLTSFLSREIHIPVIDQTGLTGNFNYFLDINAYVTEEIRKSGGPGGGAAAGGREHRGTGNTVAARSQAGVEEGAGRDAGDRSHRKNAVGELTGTIARDAMRFRSG
jgi:uncharacterized protein (TIGR03435 family)